MISHGLLVDVQALLGVLYKVAMLDEVEEVGAARCVDLFGVWVLVLCHGDLWLVDVEEAHWVAICHGTGFFRVERVVRG